MSTIPPKYVSTTNACKLCAPLGASIAFKGVEGAVPFLHGSQGCATYMRRYIISHFNEPIDIASSALGEKNAIFGGGPNLKLGLTNVIKKYHPTLIGIATTCLTETIGDDVSRYLNEYAREVNDPALLPVIVQVSTPSYSGTHMDGFHAAITGLLDSLAEKGTPNDTVTILPGLVSPADLRHLREMMTDFSLAPVILPDYSDTLDGPALVSYQNIPDGGTTIDEIKKTGGSQAVIEFGRTLADLHGGGELLSTRFGVSRHCLGLPMGIRETDAFVEVLTSLSGCAVMPAKYSAERGRLIDSLVDGHKYISGKRAVIYGEEDLVVGLAAFLSEIGIKPILCASGGKSGHLAEAIHAVTDGVLSEMPLVREGTDFFEIAEEATELSPDIIIGHSKGYPLARKLGIPLIRLGFPIHDRMGGQRILHLGYRGAQRLFDEIVNAIIDQKQSASPIGYSYM
ncbi:MAG: nitrogenase component 1 [Desulfobulbaceae bacterium]|nr:nitrogenase component 1 [Desulfobulbaceae bacterium]